MKLKDLRNCTTPNELAHRTGLKPQFVRGLIRDGLIEAHKWSNRWYVPEEAAAEFIGVVETYQEDQEKPLNYWEGYTDG